MITGRTNGLFLVVSLFVFFGYSLALEKNRELISWQKIEKNKISIGINPHLKKKHIRADFFAEYSDDIDIAAMPRSIALLPFILNIYSMVWVSGEDYFIDEMDEDVFYSLENIKKLFKRFYPKTRFDGSIRPRKLVKNTPMVPMIDTEKNIAMLFSLGLDSMALSYEHRDKKQLLITARGQADLPTKKSKPWQKRKKRLIAYAEQHGHSNAFVSCNYTEFFKWLKVNKISKELPSWRVDTIEGIGLMGVVAPILYGKGYPVLYIGSSYTWDYPYPSAANPLVDGSLVIADVFCLRHAHFDRTRFDKVKLLVDLVKNEGTAIPQLVVCDFSKKIRAVNCSVGCVKCLTVTNVLLALGEDPAEYGFNTTEKKIISKTKKFINEKPYYWAMWNFWDIQRKLKAMEEVPASVRWLMDTKLTKEMTAMYSVGQKIKVNWQEFKDLAPADLVIPPVSAADFLQQIPNEHDTSE